MTRVPGGALQQTELGSGTLSQELQVISAVLVRREIVPEHLIQTQWHSTELGIFSLVSSGSSPNPWLLNNTKFPKFKPAPELNQINHLIPQVVWDCGVRYRHHLPYLALVVLKTHPRAWSMFSAGWSVSGFQRLFLSGFREEDEQGTSVKQAELW